jgi:hypothetical protein
MEATSASPKKVEARDRKSDSSGPSGRQVAIGGILGSLALCGLILLGGATLTAVQHPPDQEGFHYYWQLANPTFWSRATAWSGYALHQLALWVCIYLAQVQRPRYTERLHALNWAALGVNVLFILLHFAQTQLWYDGLAQDVPEPTALGVVAFMLMVIVIFETPRRGLAFGKKVRFDRRFLEIVRKYHGYVFSFAIVYTFWYHPMEATPGHLAGFFYMFVLLLQSSLFFTKLHVNRIWTFLMEFLVLPHSVFTAVMTGNRLVPMFAFGFLGMLVVAQMYGLGLPRWAKWAIGLGYIAAVLVGYIVILGEPARISEIVRIPLLEYAVIGLCYLLFLGVTGATRLVQKLKIEN